MGVGCNGNANGHTSHIHTLSYKVDRRQFLNSQMPYSSMLLLEFFECKRARFRNKFFFGIKKVIPLNHLLFPALLAVLYVCVCTFCSQPCLYFLFTRPRLAQPGERLTFRILLSSKSKRTFVGR